MKFVAIVCVSLILTIDSAPTGQPTKAKTTAPKAEASNKDVAATAVATADKTATAVAATANKNTTKTAAAAAAHCSRLLATMAVQKASGIPQNCTVHPDCMGACCTTTILAHNLTYNFSVLPCANPSVKLDFNISDIDGARYLGEFTKSDSITIPKGNMSYPGFYETESTLDIVLEKVVDITHFRLDFGVHYRVLKNDPLKAIFSHTLVPMLTLEYSKELCVKPTVPPQIHTNQGEVENGELIFGMIPKSYVKDKTTLALIGTSVGLAAVLIIALIYFVISKRRSDGFYRTYISTDENRHLTKGNDGFEPLDDSDID